MVAMVPPDNETTFVFFNLVSSMSFTIDEPMMMLPSDEFSVALDSSDTCRDSCSFTLLVSWSCEFIRLRVSMCCLFMLAIVWAKSICICC